jgi:hypothetical protein
MQVRREEGAVRPFPGRVRTASRSTALDRDELGALLTAGLGPAPGHALIFLPALNALRVCGATGVGIQALGAERGHRTP